MHPGALGSGRIEDGAYITESAGPSQYSDHNGSLALHSAKPCTVLVQTTSSLDVSGVIRLKNCFFKSEKSVKGQKLMQVNGRARMSD